MYLNLKNIVVAGTFLLVGFIGLKTYRYFFDMTPPHVMLMGIEKDSFYAGDMQCAVKSNKGGDISLWLDGQPLVARFGLSGNSEHSFVIPTKTIAHGPHTLKASFVDNTYRKNTAQVEQVFTVDNVPLQAAFARPDADYKVLQGRTFHVQFQVNKPIKEAKIKTLSNEFPCFAEAKNSLIYEAYIPVACEENPNEYIFSIEIVDHVGNRVHLDNKFQVVLFPFKKQGLKIEQEKIKEEAEQAQDQNLEDAIAKATAESPREKLWRGSFCTPIDVQRVTCDFGTIRTTQHRGRYAHRALDVISFPPRSLAWASADGKVAIKGRYEVSGNTVVLDHGWGILSLYFHLDDFAKGLEVGKKVEKGNPIGMVGKTGYATGYHLHWEMRINNVPVDPMQWTKPLF